MIRLDPTASAKPIPQNSRRAPKTRGVSQQERTGRGAIERRAPNPSLSA
jgi:hypothetical protein